jgi:predicted metal-dependent hydrolase
MVTEENLNLLKSYENLKYIVMCRSNEEEKFMGVFQRDKFNVVEGRDRKKKVEILMKPASDTVYLLCKSEGRKNKEQAMRNSREKKLEKDLENLQNQIQKGREHDPVKVEQIIGRIKERFGKVSQYYEISYAHGEFSYTFVEGEKIPKRVSNSLKKLKEKATANAITFPAIAKRLAAIQEKYPADFGKIKIHLISPVLTWAPIEEIREKETGLDAMPVNE